MEINVDCPRCTIPLAMDEDMLGRPFTCPSCHGMVTIPKKKLPLPPPTRPSAASLAPKLEPPVMPPYTGPRPMQARANLALCPDCNNEVSYSALTCPKCGRKLRSEQTAGGLLAAIIIGFVIFWILTHLPS